MRTFILVCLAVLAAGCGRKKGDYSVPAMTRSLTDKDPDVRSTAATVLGKYGPEAREAVPALTAALKDDDKDVRRATAYALARIGRDARDAIPSLKETLRDKDPKVREAAAYALKEIQNPSPKQQSHKKKKGA
jgi:HEAT repeat protein